MDAAGRRKRLEQARGEAERCKTVLAQLTADDAAAEARLREIAALDTLTRDRLLERENLERQRQRLVGEIAQARGAAEKAQAALASAERRIGGILSIRGHDEWGIGPSALRYLREEDGATMRLDPQGVVAVWREDRLFLPYASLSQIVTEDGSHDAAWCAAAAARQIEGLEPARVLDAQLMAPFRFGTERPETVLSRLRDVRITLGPAGLDVAFKGKTHVVPYGLVLVAQLEPAPPPADAERVSNTWFKLPGKKPPSMADRLVMHRDPAPSAPFGGIPLGASGLHKWLDVARRPGLNMWLGKAGVHVSIDGRHWIIPHAAVRFAKLGADTQATGGAEG